MNLIYKINALIEKSPTEGSQLSRDISHDLSKIHILIYINLKV